MPEEFEGDLAGAVFWGADLSGASFRDVNLTDVTISHAWLVGVDIDALVDRVVINGVDVTAYVNERDPWYPLRAMLRPASPEAMRATWAALEDEWAKTIARAQALPEDARHESVNDEWSFVQTLRHLVFAMDKWFTVPILGEGFHPMGLPNSGSVDFGWPGLDANMTPSLSEALAVRADRVTRLRDYLGSVITTDFARPIDVLENGTNPLQECLFTVFEEEFWHHRYAQRDLAHLEATKSSDRGPVPNPEELFEPWQSALVTPMPSDDHRAGWVLDEVAFAGRENLDAAHVARYDDKEDAQAGAEVQVLQRLGLDESSLVLDVGAGTGQITLAVAPVCRRVIAVDISPVMLERLRANVAARGLSNVECIHAGFLTYEHAGEPVDFAYSRYALHHLPDFWKALALARLSDVLRPGGVLRLRDVVYRFEPGDAPAHIEAWCSTGTADVESGWTRAELEEHVRDEHSTFTWLLESMITRAGFVIEAAEYSDDQFLASYILRKPLTAPPR